MPDAPGGLRNRKKQKPPLGALAQCLRGLTNGGAGSGWSAQSDLETQSADVSSGQNSKRAPAEASALNRYG